jgi:hypothetical protein
LKVIQQQDHEASDYIRKKVIEHNMSQLPEQSQTPKENVSFVLKNDDGEILAGVTGTMYWHHLHIDFLWVDKNLRHGG